MNPHPIGMLHLCRLLSRFSLLAGANSFDERGYSFTDDVLFNDAGQALAQGMFTFAEKHNHEVPQVLNCKNRLSSMFNCEFINFRSRLSCSLIPEGVNLVMVMSEVLDLAAYPSFDKQGNQLPWTEMWQFEFLGRIIHDSNGNDVVRRYVCPMTFVPCPQV